MRKRQALAAHENVAVPQAIAAADQQFRTLGLRAGIMRDPDAKPRATKSHDPKVAYYVSDLLVVDVVINNVNHEFVVSFTTCIAPDGTPDVEQVRTRVCEEIDDRHQVGFSGFDFRLALHTSDIPTGVIVEVAAFDHTSHALHVVLRKVTGEVISDTEFEIGQKVYYARQLMIAHDTTLMHPSTFVASCVKTAIAGHLGRPAPHYSNPIPPAEFRDFDLMCKTMVNDFATHAEIVTAAHTTQTGETP